MTAATIVNDFFRNVLSYFRVSKSYFRKRNPIMNGVISVLNQIYNILSLRRNLRGLKSQVQLQYYRMQRMEKLMNEGNPYNLQGGFHINRFR